MEGEQDLVERLRAGDEAAFTALVRNLHGRMLRFVSTFVGNPATAEEVVQDTWLAVLEGLGRFAGRSSLKSWIFAILANKARTRAVRDGKTVFFSDMASDEEDEPAVDPARFSASGYWHLPPRPWDTLTPERVAASTQIREHLARALDQLPPAQRAVVVLRDVEGFAAEEVCALLGITEANQRVLLHRGRARLRRLLEPVMERGG